MSNTSINKERNGQKTSFIAIYVLFGHSLGLMCAERISLRCLFVVFQQEWPDTVSEISVLRNIRLVLRSFSSPLVYCLRLFPKLNTEKRSRNIIGLLTRRALSLVCLPSAFVLGAFLDMGQLFSQSDGDECTAALPNFNSIFSQLFAVV